MHARLIVLVDKKDGDTSEYIRYKVNDRLADEGFSDSGGIFNSAPADWYVIGGRFSGWLTELRLDQDKVKAFWKEFGKRRLGWVSKEHPEEEQRAKVELLFLEYFPDFKGMMPVYRDYSYESLGFEDDAQILDELLLSRFINLGLDTLFQPYPEMEVESGRCYVDLDDPGTPLTIEDIGNKWVVVVDFHF